jgi:hypothetical protein
MHQAVAFRATYLVTGDASEAEDAAQEAFVKAYRALGRFRPGAPANRQRNGSWFSSDEAAGRPGAETRRRGAFCNPESCRIAARLSRRGSTGPRVE